MLMAPCSVKSKTSTQQAQRRFFFSSFVPSFPFLCPPHTHTHTSPQLGSILINLGTNLMKLGHNKSLALEEFERNNAPASPSSSATLPPASSLGMKDNNASSLPPPSKHRPRRNARSKPRPARSFREWQAGIALFAGGNVFNFVSFGFAAQSLLAALGSVQFVSNVVFARLVLKEAVTWRVLGATALIVTGARFLVPFFFLFF